jgi:tRNA(Ile)-lysidine synthase TilS/MesJ
MLGVTKNEITNFMTTNAFAWREDASNLDITYKRNEIRRDLVPLLAALTGSQDALYK